MANPDRIDRMMSQNQRKMYTFSLMMFNARTHRASCFWIVPDDPYFINVHLVIRGNTFFFPNPQQHLISTWHIIRLKLDEVLDEIWLLN